jgi:cardiolipin synthase
MANTQKAQEKVFHNGESYFSSLLRDIQQAKQSIDIEVYIFTKDRLGRRILRALLHAAKHRKLQVRLLVDGVGSPFWGGKLVRKLEKSGIKTKVFHPLPWDIGQWRRSTTRLPFLLHVLYMFSKINSRNHRKCVIIDGKIAYIGSINIDKRHLSSRSGGQNWRDTAIRLKGYNLDDMREAFNSAWDQRHQWGNSLENLCQQKIRLNCRPKFRFFYYKNLLKSLAKTKRRVWITNAYFIPNHLFLIKIKKLAKQGVDVRLMVPEKSDVSGMQWAANSLYKNLIHAGIKIYEYRPSMLHAKTIIIDDQVIVGSSNLNHRSLLHDLEVDVTLESAEAKQAVIRQFIRDIADSQAITLENIPVMTWHKRFVAGFFVLFKYWM